MSELLCIDRVCKSYGAHVALHEVSFHVGQGEIYGLLGPNGAGKTTLIRLINQILFADSGQILMRGKPIQSRDARRIGYLPEERGLYKKMRVGDQAIFLARLKGMTRHDAVTQLKRWFARLQIEPWWGKRVEELSKGMAQKVQFIVTVLHQPELLILDEPFSGFDPINADVLTREILELRRNGVTILFSTHNMDSVQALCDSITLINQSRNILSGPIDEVRRRFSQPTYTVCYEGPAVSLSEWLPSGWRVSREWTQDRTRSCTIELSAGGEDVTVSELARALPPDLPLKRISRDSASMHDIFIRAVESAEAGARV